MIDASPRCAARPAIVRDLLVTMRQGRELVAALSERAYAERPEALQASSIGAHYRHHIEHVQILLAAAEHHALVDYDCRERDPEIETDRQVALLRTDALIARLELLDDASLDQAVTIAHRTCTEDLGRQAPSTLRRELLFLLSHAVHHYALMKLVAASHGHLSCEEFGVMPSTLAHLKG